MATLQATSSDLQIPHIGAKPHLVRNLLLGAGAGLAVLLMWGFYGRDGDPGHPAIAELDHFRAAMSHECKDPSFAGPTDPALARLYTDNSQLRTTIIERYHALQRGQASCEQVLASIKSAGYPLR